jgi:hypothetical protein
MSEEPKEKVACLCRKHGRQVGERSEHTQECIEAFAKYEKELFEFSAKYPNYCRECNAFGGGYQSFDPSPAGVALSSGHLLDYAPCQKCDGYCPLCGRLLDDEEYDNGHCLRCGWDWESGPFAPPEPECYCWEIAL